MKKIILLIFLLNSLNVFSDDIVKWNSSVGIERLERSQAKVDFFELANNFIGQPNGLLCAATTGAIVMNALRIRSDKDVPMTIFSIKNKKHIPSGWDPRFKRFTPENFLDEKIKTWSQVYGEPINEKKDFGFQLRQLHNAFKALKVDSKINVANKKINISDAKKEIIKTLKTKNNYVVINYSRKSLKQKGGGHVSPLGAYDKESDSFLIIDVNPNKDNWVWVKSKTLFKSMMTFDTVENRGYLLIKDL
jgi:hypothetical protein